MTPGPETGGPQFLVAVLERELEGFRQFRSILESEQAALLANRVDDLLPLAQRKNIEVATLANLAEERNVWLKQTVGATNQVGIESWLERFDPADHHGVGKRWRALIDGARAARDLNQLNGQLINTQLASNQQALQVLMGANASTANLYGRDGQAYTGTPGTGGRSLGKA